MDTQGVKTRVVEKLLSKAAKDEQFRSDLLNNTRATIEKELEITIPAGLTVTVVEETPQCVYLVLPQSTAVVSDELTEAELASVSGGNEWTDDQECYTEWCDII